MPSTALIKLYLLINLISCIMILVIETVDKMDKRQSLEKPVETRHKEEVWSKRWKAIWKADKYTTHYPGKDGESGDPRGIVEELETFASKHTKDGWSSPEEWADTQFSKQHRGSLRREKEWRRNSAYRYFPGVRAREEQPRLEHGKVARKAMGAQATQRLEARGNRRRGAEHPVPGKEGLESRGCKS